MGIEFLFPKVCKLSRQAFTNIGCSDFINDYQSDRFWAIWSSWAIVIMIIIFCVCRFIDRSFKSADLLDGNSTFAKFIHNLYIAPLVGGFICLFSAFVFSFSATLDMHNINSQSTGFKINQTSFCISPIKTKPNIELTDYLTKTNQKIVTTSDYVVYAKVNDIDKSVKTYLFAESHDGVLTAPSLDTVKKSRVKTATPEMLNALFSYAKYIENHHLEDEFKNDAKLKFTNKYLDAKYNPTLVMQGKNGQILHMKNKANVSDKNVVLDK